jgi:hypothetical protein
MQEITYVPTQIVQGTSPEWSVSFDDYPPSAWTLTYEFRGASKLTVTAAVVGNSYNAQISKAQSNALLPGMYQYQAFVLSSDATERYMVDSGSVAVIADYAGMTQGSETDARSSSRRIYDNLTKILENASAVKALPSDQLDAMYRQWQQLKWDIKREEDAEKVRRGGGQSRKIYTRFMGAE